MDHLIIIIMVVFFLAVFIDIVKTAIGIIREDIPALFETLHEKVKKIFNKSFVKLKTYGNLKSTIHDHPKASRLVQDSVIYKDKVIIYQYVSEYYDNGKSYRDFKSQDSLKFHIWGFVKAHVLIFGCPLIGDELTIDEDAPSITRQCYPRNSGYIACSSEVIIKIIKIRKVKKSDKGQQESEEQEILSYVPMYLQILDYKKSWANNYDKWRTFGTYHWDNGEYYVGQFKNGKFHGKGQHHWTDGNSYKCIHENGEHIEWVYCWEENSDWSHWDKKLSNYKKYRFTDL